MYRQYRSDYSNQVHQFIVSVSRHFYVTAGGKLKYQKKPFDARLGNRATFTRRHVINFLIRDHFSGLFYAEITDIDNVYSACEFLHRAWSESDDHPLYGIPDMMTLPKNVRAVWPDLAAFLEEETLINLIDVTSGFQGGVRDVRSWEALLWHGMYKSGFPPDYEEVRNTAVAQGAAYYKEKVDIWTRNLPEDVYVPSDMFLANCLRRNGVLRGSDPNPVSRSSEA